MAQNKFRGLGIALITPFKTDGSIDFDALDRLVEYQIKGRADFLCIMGTTAETPTLSREEKRLLKEHLVERVAGRVPLLMGCGGNNTAAILDELQNEDWKGIDGVLSVCPYYNKPSQEGLYQHFAAIAKVSPVPVVLYNVPGRTGVNMTAETTLRLAREFENIVAIKEASGNITQMDDIIKNKPQHFDVISVIGNALPAEFSRMVRLALRGEYSSSLTIHHKFTELFKLLFVDGNPAGVKAMLSEMGMIQNVLRLPLVPTRLTTMEKISQIVRELGY